MLLAAIVVNIHAVPGWFAGQKDRRNPPGEPLAQEACFSRGIVPENPRMAVNPTRFSWFFCEVM